MFKLFLISVLLFSPLSAFAQASNPKPKCEKCYRGPEGKVVCDPVPCPKK